MVGPSTEKLAVWDTGSLLWSPRGHLIPYRAAVAAFSEQVINKHESEGLDATVPHPSWMDTFGEPLRRGVG